MSIQFVERPEEAPSLFFSDVPVNQFFKALSGGLYQKIDCSRANKIARSGGSLYSGQTNEFARDSKVIKIYDVKEIKFD